MTETMFEKHTNMSNHSVEDGEYLSSEIAITVRAIGASVCYLVSIFIVVVNTLFLICFYINRRKEWVSHSKNIISLLLMDWLVGVTGVYMLAFAALKNVNLYLCTFSQTLCISSQVGSHVNIFRLCVFRFKSARTREIVKESSTKSIILQTVLVYIVSTTVCSLPVFIWATDDIILERCLWTIIYKQNSGSANRYMLYVTLIPTVATSILYVALCIELKRSVALITPLQNRDSGPGPNVETSFTNKQRQTSYNQPSTRNQQNSSLFLTKFDTDTESRRLNMKEANASDKVSSEMSMSSDMSPNKATKTTVLSAINTDNVTNRYLQVPSTSKNQLASRNNLRNLTNMTSQTPSFVHAQRSRVFNVFKTVGAILLCMNISILPYIIAVAVSVYQGHKGVSGDVFFFVSSFLLLNSALDPIIYILRIKHLKIAFQRMVKSQCCTFQCFHNTT